MSQTQQAIDPKVVERIRKTLNLSRDGGATEAEAAAAAEMAQKLMRKYNLTMAEVETTEGSKRTKEKIRGRAQYEFQRDLMNACAEVNFCAVLIQNEWRRGRTYAAGFVLIGREANVIAAQNLYDYLVSTTERLAFEYVGSNNGMRMSRKAMSFKEGCAERLSERIRARHAEALDAQAREAREAAAAARHPGASSSGTSLVLLKNVEQDEKDLNNDYRYGLEPGTTARRRLEMSREAEIARAARLAIANYKTMDREGMSDVAFNAAKERAVALGLDVTQESVLDDIHIEVQGVVTARMNVLEEKEELDNETPAQRKRRLEQEERDNKRFWERYWKAQERAEARRDQAAYKSGARAGERVGLDKQVHDGVSPNLKALQ